MTYSVSMARRRPRRIERALTGQSSPYPWEQWLQRAQREVVTLRRGTDFNGRSDTFVQQVRNWAGRLGHRVRTRQGEDGQSVSFWVRGSAADGQGGEDGVGEEG